MATMSCSEEIDEAPLLEMARRAAVAFINERFPDIDSLEDAPQTLNELTLSKVRLERAVSFATEEVPRNIMIAIEKAEAMSEKVNALHMEQDQLVGDIHSHVVDNTVMANKLSQTMKQICELEKYMQYLLCISHFEDLSADIQSALLIKATERSIEQFTLMAEHAGRLQNSGCRHLVKFINDTVLFWFRILLEKLSGEFNECLSAWQWPFIVSSLKSAPPVPAATESKEKLGTLFAQLTMLQLPEDFQKADKTSDRSVFASKLPKWRPLSLPFQLLLKPLQKRFIFHFYGNKKTNSLDKPEWYFTQILTWIKDHREFLRTKIQPELDKSSGLDALTEFSRGLVALAVDKLYSDMPELLLMNIRFAHVLDESLAFHKELCLLCSYPDSQPSCLDVLIQPEPFKHWLHIEKQFALQKMDSMLSSPSAWKSQYEDSADVDSLKVSECGESFMLLLLTITDRYRLLPSVECRMDFLRLQLELLDDFRIRLLQVKKEIFPNRADHLNRQYCAIVNTVDYINDVLCQWANLPFFVKLHYYKMKAKRKETYNEDDIQLDEDEDGKCLEPSVFEEIVDLFELMQKDMLANILSFVFDDVKARSRPYRQERWMALPSRKEYTAMALSGLACEMLLVLKDHLHNVEALLSKSLFAIFWQQLAESINRFIFSEVILQNSFNDGGAHQLQFDMTRNLFTLFGQYTAKPENYFKDVKESCIVLTLSAGSALLIKEVIYHALHDPHSLANTRPTDPIAALHDIGIYKLTLEEVETLLSLRIDLSD